MVQKIHITPIAFALLCMQDSEVFYSCDFTFQTFCRFLRFPFSFLQKLRILSDEIIVSVSWLWSNVHFNHRT